MKMAEIFGNTVKSFPHIFNIIFPFFFSFNTTIIMTLQPLQVQSNCEDLRAKRKYQVNQCHTATLRTTNAITISISTSTSGLGSENLK